jgi:tetratricopeptide (TPR) repeat protein
MDFVSSAEKLIKKGRSLLVEGDFEHALGFFEEALLSNHDDPDLWNYKGIALRSLGRYDEAIICFNLSLKIDPRDRNAS